MGNDCENWVGENIVEGWKVWKFEICEVKKDVECIVVGFCFLMRKNVQVCVFKRGNSITCIAFHEVPLLSTRFFMMISPTPPAKAAKLGQKVPLKWYWPPFPNASTSNHPGFSEALEPRRVMKMKQKCPPIIARKQGKEL